VSVDDVQIILGPNTSLISTVSEAEKNDEALNESYDASNGYNIFSHQIRFTIDGIGDVARLLIEAKQKKVNKKKQETEEQSVFQGYLINILKNIKLNLNRIHIRYEDDYFSQLNPFAFGILCDQISSYGSETEWQFASQENNQFRRTRPQYFI